MTKHFRKSNALPLLTAALLLGGAGAATSTGKTPPLPFPVADLFFELNDSAGDLGIHAEIDGGPWTTLEVDGPRGRKLLSIVSKGRLRTQGLTQLAFESAEPPFSELDPADFFRRFPEGPYDIEARLQGGGTLESTVDLSHVLAASPDNITVGGLPAANCDDEPLPEVDAPVLFRWDPVTQSHPEIGKAGPVEISRYQFFVELQGGTLGLDLSPTTTEYVVPFSAADRGRVFKIAGENGWQLRFADSAVEQKSRTTTLHGSIQGLTPEEALSAVLPTVGVEHRLEDGVLLIRLSARDTKD